MPIHAILLLQVLLLPAAIGSLPVTTANNAVSIQNPLDEKEEQIAEAERVYQELMGYVVTINKYSEEIIDTFQAQRRRTDEANNASDVVAFVPKVNPKIESILGYVVTMNKYFEDLLDTFQAQRQTDDANNKTLAAVVPEVGPKIESLTVDTHDRLNRQQRDPTASLLGQASTWNSGKNSRSSRIT